MHLVLHQKLCVQRKEGHCVLLGIGGCFSKSLVTGSLGEPWETGSDGDLVPSIVSNPSLSLEIYWDSWPWTSSRLSMNAAVNSPMEGFLGTNVSVPLGLWLGAGCQVKLTWTGWRVASSLYHFSLLPAVHKASSTTLSSPAITVRLFAYSHSQGYEGVLL